MDLATRYTFDFVSGVLPCRPARILEVGCGTGALARALQTAGHAVVAIDADDGAVEAARTLGVDARHATWPEFAHRPFDAVLFTRSLHHVGDLGESLDAAFAALAPGGRVIVEDFMAEGAPAATDAWFRSLVRLFDETSRIAAPTPFLASLLGRAAQAPHDTHDAHDHHLHASTRIEAELAARGPIRASGAAYCFRYLLPALAEAADGAALLRHELALIEAGVIAPLGRRYVADSRG